MTLFLPPKPIECTHAEKITIEKYCPFQATITTIIITTIMTIENYSYQSRGLLGGFPGSLAILLLRRSPSLSSTSHLLANSYKISLMHIFIQTAVNISLLQT